MYSQSPRKTTSLAMSQPQPHPIKLELTAEEEKMLAMFKEGKIEEMEIMRTMPQRQIQFLDLPPEIHLRILQFVCDGFSAICFSLVSKYLYDLFSPFTRCYNLELSSGSPSSTVPCPNPTGCRHCVPVLYSPAHCELHYHIRSFFPREYTYCGNCNLFTLGEQKDFSDSKRHCGGCGIAYRRRYARGRRFLDVKEGEGGWKRGSRWYNVSG